MQNIYLTQDGFNRIVRHLTLRQVARVVIVSTAEQSLHAIAVVGVVREAWEREL